MKCYLCPRMCGADREKGETGYCGADDRIRVGRAMLHMWEEPCISGTNGSGAVFFCGCSLGCVYCQNRKISGGTAGEESGEIVSIRQLSDIFLQLEKQGAHNINLVTAGHYVPQVREALLLAKEDGLSVPVVYNSSGYEKPDTLRMLDGLVDIYLPDLKYVSSEPAGRWSNAPDYPKWAVPAITEMLRQTGSARFDERGLMKRGVIVRHLLLPGHVKESKRVVDTLLRRFGSRIWISLMSQYTPMPEVRNDPLLGRKVTAREYRRLLDYALEAGLENGFMQEGAVAEESFIPEFGKIGINAEKKKKNRINADEE